MLIHASCAARLGPNSDDGILLVGPPGSGKSDMVLRLVHAGWKLVADDQVVIEQGAASAPPELAGILEVRGLGLFRMPFLRSVSLRLIVRLDGPFERLPEPERHKVFDLPVISLDAGSVSAVERLSIALDAACGRVTQVAGAFAT